MKGVRYMRSQLSVVGTVGGALLLLLAGACGSDGNAALGSESNVGVADEAVTMTMLGADVSSVQRALDLGAPYYDAAGTRQDPLDILKGAGVNYVRLRIWNNPVSGYNNKAKVLAYAQTVKSKGLKLLIDFHYSDTWADPNAQTKPAAWSSHTISQLQTDVSARRRMPCNSATRSTSACCGTTARSTAAISPTCPRC
jgi:arabinogalactan endo-1,4-beta-galactosidase